MKWKGIRDRMRMWWYSRETDLPARLFSVNDIRMRFEGALREEADLAQRHRMDSYYTDLSTGRNVGEDEFMAIRYARSIKAQPLADEEKDPDRYLRRLLRDLERTKKTFKASEADCDGYGIGTLHSLTEKLVVAFGEKYRPREIKGEP